MLKRIIDFIRKLFRKIQFKNTGEYVTSISLLITYRGELRNRQRNGRTLWKGVPCRIDDTRNILKWLKNIDDDTNLLLEYDLVFSEKTVKVEENDTVIDMNNYPSVRNKVQNLLEAMES